MKKISIFVLFNIYLLNEKKIDLKEIIYTKYLLSFNNQIT